MRVCAWISDGWGRWGLLGQCEALLWMPMQCRSSAASIRAHRGIADPHMNCHSVLWQLGRVSCDVRVCAWISDGWGRWGLLGQCEALLWMPMQCRSSAASIRAHRGIADPHMNCHSVLWQLGRVSYDVRVCAWISDGWGQWGLLGQCEALLWMPMQCRSSAASIRAHRGITDPHMNCHSVLWQLGRVSCDVRVCAWISDGWG